MVNRKDAVEFLNHQFEIETHKKEKSVGTFHYGLCELRQLFDFIYEGKPTNIKEEIHSTETIGVPYSGSYRPWEDG